MTRFEFAKSFAKNRQQIKKAITQFNRSMNQGIRENKKELEDSSISTIMILYGAFLEASLGYIVHFYGAQITVATKNKILSQSSAIDKWTFLIEHLFRKKFLKGRRKALNLLNLGHTNFSRYEYLSKVCEESIRSTIEIRNKLAHGQWAVAFTTDGKDNNQEITTKIWTLTKKDILLTKNIVTKFIEIVESLAASDKHFSNCFDDSVHRLETNKAQYEKRYNWLIDEIKRKKFA